MLNKLQAASWQKRHQAQKVCPLQRPTWRPSCESSTSLHPSNGIVVIVRAKGSRKSPELSSCSRVRLGIALVLQKALSPFCSK